MIQIANDTFLRAARGEKVEETPIWIMRQAGRVLPGYRAVRGKHSFLEIARRPELCAEVTVEPVEVLGVDAAILFSDILLPLEAVGVGVDFDPGPILSHRFEPKNGIESLRVPDPSRDYAYLADCVEATLDRLAGRVPLIGFAGAPFTLATYLLEGGSSKNYGHTRAWMNTDPDAFLEFLLLLAERVAEWLRVQVLAGVSALQLFDSWAGILSPEDFEHFAMAAARRVFAAVEVSEDFPTIYFAPGAGTTLNRQRASGASVIGVDWRVNLAEARRAVNGIVLQGNLDPGALLGSPSELERKTAAVLSAAGTGGGHIFNLGHGILPSTPLDNAKLLVRFVHELSRKEPHHE